MVDRSVATPATTRSPQAILEVYPDAPDVLIGHSLGAITALALLEREPGWARTVILEEPASSFAPEAAMREDRGVAHGGRRRGANRTGRPLSSACAATTRAGRRGRPLGRAGHRGDGP